MGKQQGIRILHCGDVYLGRPFSTLAAKSSERRRSEIKQTFKDLLHYVEEEQIHIVLLSGNLFDFDFVNYETVAWVMREMEKMSSTRFMIAPGMADRLDGQSFYEVCHLPKNVHVFSAKAECVELPKWRITVFGWGLAAEQEERCPLSKLSALHIENTLLVCGCVSPLGQAGVRVSPEEISSSGAVYVGLSNGEGFSGFAQTGETVAANSGWLESSSFSHEGFGGANLLTLMREGEYEIPTEQESEPEELAPAEQMTYFETAEETPEESNQNQEEEQKPRMEFDISEGKLIAERLLFGGRQYITETIDISDFSSVEQVEEALCALVREKGYGAETSLCVVLVGHTAPEFIPPRLRDHTAHGLAELLSVDKSVPDRDDEEYLKDMSVRGELMRAMMPSILNGDEKSKENAIKALRIAFLALDNDGSYHI